MYKQLLIAFMVSFWIISVNAGLRTIVNSSGKDETFTAVQLSKITKGRLTWESIGGINPTTVKSNHAGTIDLGDGNQSCVNIQANSQQSWDASAKLCDGGQLCWDGKSFGWQAWGVDCNGINPRYNSQ